MNNNDHLACENDLQLTIKTITLFQTISICFIFLSNLLIFQQLFSEINASRALISAQFSFPVFASVYVCVQHISNRCSLNYIAK